MPNFKRMAEIGIPIICMLSAVGTFLYARGSNDGFLDSRVDHLEKLTTESKNRISENRKEILEEIKDIKTEIRQNNLILQNKVDENHRILDSKIDHLSREITRYLVYKGSYVPFIEEPHQNKK